MMRMMMAILKSNKSKLSPKRAVNNSDADPTNQAQNRAKANRDNNSRLNGAAKQILALWSDVEAKRIVRKDIVNNAETVFYEYPNPVPISQEEINAIVDAWLETAVGDIPFDWYFKEYDEQAYRGGTQQENAWIEAITAAIVGFALLQNEAIFLSPEYNQALDLIQTNDYRLLKKLSRNTSEQVFQVIQSGIDGGFSKKAIRRKIVERFEVSKSSAKRIVETEINKAANNARLDLVSIYANRGERLGVMHISALIPTTRENHAARHGKVYTVQQQRKWWDTGANRINCHCSVRSAVITRSGQVVDKGRQQKEIKKGKDFFRNIT